MTTAELWVADLVGWILGGEVAGMTERAPVKARAAVRNCRRAIRSWGFESVVPLTRKGKALA